MFLTLKDYEKVQQVVDHYAAKLDLSAAIAKEEFYARYKKVWKQLEERELDFGFFFWYREMPGDGIYLTGYNPTLEKACAVIAPGRKPLLLVGPESGKWAKEAGLDLECKFTEEFSLPDEYYEGVTCASLPRVIQEYVGHEIKRIGIMTSLDVVTAKVLDIFRNDVPGAPELVDAADILADLRYDKSDAEFHCMKQADIIAAAAIRAMLAVIRPGLRELQVTAVGDYVVKALGGESYGAESMAASGERNRYIIAPASNKIIEEGEIVQLSSVPSFQGYKGVCRRTVVAGKRNAVQKEFFEKMNHGYELAVAELKNVIEKDLPINRVDLAARDYFATQEIEGINMKSLHFYSTSHGTGLTECLEKIPTHPLKEDYYGKGKNVGMMLDLGLYDHPDKDICGGCVESAFFKKGNIFVSLTDLPVDVQDLVGKGL
ncbi:M24 family metallopeptidase [Anaerolentibacter hominis]|uniref:M24 family metallopeptidase n=1 Tax=Anaerolentibacter hominis TaxID=3079009 RepID=UPI0031B864D9